MIPARILAATLCGVVFIVLTSPLRAVDERVERIIANVRTNEALYQRIEAHVTASYKLQNEDLFREPDLIKSGTQHNRTVL